MLSKGFNFIRSFCQKLYFFFTTTIVRVYMILAGASLGKNSKFFGLPHVQKASSGDLRIGNACSFRSKKTANLIGINRPCIISVHPKASLNIQEGCGLSGTVIGCFKEITLEKHVRCGANTLITDSDWHLDDPRSGKPQPVYIEENVWLGEGVKVLKGVRIGKNSVIGAGSIVVKDIPENVIAAGNPCKILKKIC